MRVARFKGAKLFWRATGIGVDPDDIRYGSCRTVVGLWHMDEGSGSTMRDSWGNGNNGSIIPYIGIAMFVPAWLTAVGIPAFKFIAKLEYPLSLAVPWSRGGT